MSMPRPAWLATALALVGLLGALCPGQAWATGKAGPGFAPPLDRAASRPAALPTRDSPLGALTGPLNPFEQALVADAADGRLDRLDLLDAALVASGARRPQDIRRLRERFDGLAAEVRAACRRTTGLPHTACAGYIVGPGTVPFFVAKQVAFPDNVLDEKGDCPPRAAQAVLEFMHARILTGGYALENTGVDLALDEGRYNCVSATVLFNCLAKAVGLEACGLESRAHATSRVKLGSAALDIETTCKDWFRRGQGERGSDPARRHDVGEAGSASSAAPREVSDVQLAAMIYYNRGVQEIGRRNFAAAIADNAKALLLDPESRVARGNLLAAMNNGSIALAAKGDYATAAGWLKESLRLEPDNAIFQANFAHVHRGWIERLCGQGRYEEAMEVLDRAAATASDYAAADDRWIERAQARIRAAAGMRFPGSSEESTPHEALDARH